MLAGIRLDHIIALSGVVPVRHDEDSCSIGLDSEIRHAGQYAEHMEYLKRVVPAERLFLSDVKDGWEPLCQILVCDVPDIPFPRVNDGEATDELIKKQIQTWCPGVDRCRSLGGHVGHYVKADMALTMEEITVVCLH